MPMIGTSEELEPKKESIITPFEKKESIITPFEVIPEIKPSDSLITQGELIIKNSVSEVNIQEMQLANIKKQSVTQIRETASIIEQQNLAYDFNEMLSKESDVDTLSIALGKIQESRANNLLALEKSVVNTLAQENLMSPQEQFISDNERNFLENLKEREIKDLAVYNKIQEIQQNSDLGDASLNLLSEVTMTSFLQRAFGFGITDYGEELRKLAIDLEQADASEAVSIVENAADLFKASEILGSNPEYLAESLSTAFTASQIEQRTATFFNVLDFADTAAIGFGVAKGFLKTAKNLGASKQLADDITEGTDKLVKDPLDKIQMGMGLTTKFEGVSNIPALVRSNHEANKRILDMALRGTKALDYQEVRNLDVIEGVRERLKNDFSNGSIAEVKVTDSGNAEVMILNKQGQPFSTKGGASRSLNARGMKGEIVEVSPNKFAIKAVVPALDAEIAELSTKGVSFWRRQLGRTESWVDDKLHLFGQQSEQSLNQITAQGQMVYDRTLGKLNKKEIDNITPVLEQQRGNKKWMDATEVKDFYLQHHKRPITEKELKAISGFELLDRFSYELDNRAIYQRKKAMGLQSVDESVFGIEINGKVTEDFIKDDLIFVSDTGALVNKMDLPDNFLKDNTVIEVDDLSGFKGREGFENLSTNPTKYMAVPVGKLKMRELDYKQLAYLQGGRNRYNNSAIFLKQANVITRQDGKRVRKNDIPLFTATNMPQAKREVDAINNVNAIIRKDPDSPEVQKQATDFIQQRGSILGAEDFAAYKKAALSRGMKFDTDVVPLRNRESIEDINIPSDFVDDDAIREVQNGRLSARGEETVPHIDQEGTSLLNPVASLNQNFIASANNLAFNAYRDYALAHMERYRRFLDVKSTDPKINLLTASIRANAKLTPEQIQRIRGEQIFSREVVGRLTVDELAGVAARESRIEYITDRIPFLEGKTKEKFVADSSEWLKEDPVGRIRGLVFNSKLGLFSLPAMAIQMAHAPIIAAMSPHGLKGMLAYPTLRIALISNDPKVIAEMAKKSEALGWKGFGDMQKFFQEFRNQGFDSFGSNAIYENAARGDDVARGNWSKFLDKSRIFFEEGELVPRITGYATAVREWNLNYKNINPKKLDIDSKAGSEYITQRTNTLTLGMTRADLQQGLKTGWVGLAAQFQSYPLRAIDALLFDSKGLSKGERTRMAIAYVGMYGTAGLPLLDSIADYFMERNPETFDATASKFIYNGLVDGLAMAITGENTNFSSRGGLGVWLDQMLDDAVNGRVMEVFLGPAGSTGMGSMDTLTEYGKAYSAGFHPDPSQITTNVIMDIAKQISSVNNVYRSWVAYNTGMIYDKRGNQFIGISNKGNLLQMLGLPPQAYEDIGKFYGSQEKRKQIITLVSKQKTLLNNEFARTDNAKRKQEIIQELNAISYYAEKDGINDEVNSRVYNGLKSDSTFRKMYNKAAFQKALGEKSVLPTEIEAVND